MTGAEEPQVDIALEAKRLGVAAPAIRRLLAKAWDEGYYAGYPERPATNPYNGKEK